MELSLAGLFFLVRDENNFAACRSQGVCVILVLFLTVGYQFLLNEAFGPLIKYLPITHEGVGLHADETFHRARLTEQSIARSQPRLNRKIRPEDLKDMDRTTRPGARSQQFYASEGHSSKTLTVSHLLNIGSEGAFTQDSIQNPTRYHPFARAHDDIGLFPTEQSHLLQHAFQHEALRAKIPVVWIPRDRLGVSDDEIYRTRRFSKHIRISNRGQALDSKCRTIFSNAPPDVSETESIDI